MSIFTIRCTTSPGPFRKTIFIRSHGDNLDSSVNHSSICCVIFISRLLLAPLKFRHRRLCTSANSCPTSGKTLHLTSPHLTPATHGPEGTHVPVLNNDSDSKKLLGSWTSIVCQAILRIWMPYVPSLRQTRKRATTLKHASSSAISPLCTGRPASMLSSPSKKISSKQHLKHTQSQTNLGADE